MCTLQVDSPQHRLLWSFVRDEVQTVDPVRNVKRTKVVLHDDIISSFFYQLEGTTAGLLRVAENHISGALRWTKLSLLSNNQLRAAFESVATRAWASTRQPDPAAGLFDLVFGLLASKYLKSRQKTWRQLNGWLPKAEAAQRAGIRATAKRVAEDD
jgi:hypothetical protein